MSTITINEDLLSDAKIAAFNGQHKGMSRETPAHQLAEEFVKYPNIHGHGFPFSGDHLGTFSHRETLWDGDPGEETRRERIHRA